MGVATTRILTTGRLAKLAGVAPRTAAKWIDSGKLKGYRIPGSKDRRVLLEDFRDFAREHGIPLDANGTLIPRVLVLTSNPGLRNTLTTALSGQLLQLTFELTLFDAGLRCRELCPCVLLVDTAVGRHESLLLARTVREQQGETFRRTTLCCIANEDERGEGTLHEAGFEIVFRRPLDVDGMAAAMLEILG